MIDCSATRFIIPQYVRTKDAALKVQAWGRMSSAKRSYQADRSRAITVQCLARKRSAKAELRKRKKEKDNVDALQAKIKAYEVGCVRVLRVCWRCLYSALL